MIYPCKFNTTNIRCNTNKRMSTIGTLTFVNLPPSQAYIFGGNSSVVNSWGEAQKPETLATLFKTCKSRPNCIEVKRIDRTRIVCVGQFRSTQQRRQTRSRLQWRTIDFGSRRSTQFNSDALLHVIQKQRRHLLASIGDTTQHVLPPGDHNIHHIHTIHPELCTWMTFTINLPGSEREYYRHPQLAQFT